MNKAESTGRPTPDDLTARARIRDAALLQFAERGVRGTTIRSVAEAAGVSPGLVQHHFGSKEALRQACDEYAIASAMTVKEKMLNEGGLNEPGMLGMALQVSATMQRYIARAMVEGSDGAARLFDHLVETTEAVLPRGMTGISPPNTSDLHAYAATMVAMQMGILVLRDHLSRALGADILTPEGYPRLALAMLEIYGDAMFSPELLETLRTELAPERFNTAPAPGAADALGLHDLAPRLRETEAERPGPDRPHPAQPKSPHATEESADD